MRFFLRTLLALPACAVVTWGAPAWAEQLARRPYIQTLTPSSAIVVWTSDVGANSIVHYGLAPSSLTQTVQLPASVTQHEVTITGLSPNTRYYYDVGSSNGVLAGGDATHYFETAPPAGTKKKFRAWIVGDSGTGGTPQANVRDAMLNFVRAYRPHMFLHMGDIAYNSGTIAEFTNYFFNMYPTILENTVTWPTLGNHEGANSDSATQTGPYYTAYVLPKAGEAGGLPSGTEAYYSFDYGNVHFIVLDSHDSPRTPGGAMLTWMQNDLAMTNQDWIIAYWHHPPYTKGTHNSDTEGQLVDMRQYALPILEAGGVDLVLGGHSHIYERSWLVDGAYNTPTTAAGHIVESHDGKPGVAGPYTKLVGNNSHDGAVYVVAGHGGASVGQSATHPLMYFSEAIHGSCILDVQDNRIDLVNIRNDGMLTDRFAIVKGTGIVIAVPNGNESLLPGNMFDIRWSTVGSIPNVKIDYSTNDGATWIPIVASTPNTGTYTWTVPAVDTAQGLVRVSDVTSANVNDESNAGFAINASAPMDVISFGDGWKYHDQGVDLGTAWLSLSYDDSTWPAGPGQLGYGDGDEATVLYNPPDPNFPTHYFRKVITLNGAVTQASLRVLHDDGVAVWVNGTQVFGQYVANGTGYSAWASATSADNEVSTAALSLSPNPFVTGDNLIAAVVKQASGTSSDISFDLELTLTVTPPMGTGVGVTGAGGSGAGTGGAGVGGASAGGAGPGSGAGTGGAATSSTGTGGAATGSTGTGGAGMGGAGSGTGTGGAATVGAGTGGAGPGSGGMGSGTMTASSSATGSGIATASSGASSTGASAAGGASGAGGGNSGDGGTEGGCGCQTSGPPGSSLGMLALAIVGLMRRRSQRRGRRTVSVDG